MRYFDRNQMTRPKFFDSPRVQHAVMVIEEFLSMSDRKVQSQRRAPVDSSLIHNLEFSNQLFEEFGRQCAYCETAERSAELVVEAHRPFGNAANLAGNTSQLHYVWLAYEWGNLLPACNICSQHKANRFPVKGGRGKVGLALERLRREEQGTLVDPTFDNIAEHLEFLPNGSINGLTSSGHATIATLNLNRQELIARRKESMVDIAVTMATSPKTFTALPTGNKYSWGGHILSSINGIIPLMHEGAVTLALLKLAQRFGLDASDLPALLVSLCTLTAEKRKKLLSPFLEGTYAGIETGTIKKAAKPPRTLRLQNLPAAELPFSNVHISNFKAIKRIDLNLPTFVQSNPEQMPCMLILGENATGKSSVLEAVALALLGTSEALELDAMLKDEEINPHELRHRPDFDNWDVLADDPLEVAVEFGGGGEKAELFGDGNPGGFKGSKSPSKIVLGYGPRRFFVKKKSRRFRAPAWRVRSLFDPMMVIANPIQWLLELKDEDKFDAAVRALRVVLMLDDNAKVLRHDGRILVYASQGVTPLSKMSVGYKSVVGLAVDVMRELFYFYDNLEHAHGVVLIDEIETHLHPRWKMQIVGLLRQAFPKVQFILTTHDPLCLRGMYEGEVFVLQRSQDNARIETLEELPSVQGMRAEQILTSEFFGLGSTDPATDAKVERYHFLTRKTDLNPEEKVERQALAAAIDNDMMVGTSIEEQTEAAAFSDLTSKTNIDDVDRTALKNPDRKRMIKEALERFQSGQGELND